MFALVYGGTAADHAETAGRIVAMETKLAAAHWDGYTGPLIDHVAEAVQSITQLGGTEEETDKALAAMVKLLRFVALSHWEHGVKHEREGT